MGKRWQGPVAHENQETGDDRCLAASSLSWETPVPLNWTHVETAATVGVIQTMERLEDGSIWGTGVFLDTEEGLRAQQECEAAQAAGMNWGVSVDLDDVSMELRIREEVLAAQEAMFDAIFGGDEESPAAEEEPDENGRVKVAEIHSGDYMTVITSARVRAASLVSIPAFIGARIELLSDDPATDEAPVDELFDAEFNPFAVDKTQVDAEIEALSVIDALSLVAGAYPVAPPAAWFENPGFTEATPLIITDEGRIYGHAATWRTFHIGFAGQRIEAPHSMADYAYFRTGYIRTAEGTDIPIGKITMTTGHAIDGLSGLDTMAHYDNTGTVVADIVCGDDGEGIWVSGALRPNVTDEQVRELRAAPLSGDWREIRGNLELVALLAVNVPGFAVPRMSALVASGEVRSLVASAAFGTVIEDGELTREEREALRALLAERNGTDSGTDLAQEEPPVDGSAGEALGAAIAEVLAKRADRQHRVAAAKRRFRIEQAKMKAKGI